MSLQRLVLAIIPLALAVPRSAASEGIEFKKTQIDKAFRSEGVTVADVDGDGKQDILAGPLWYKAPEWKPGEIAPLKAYNGETGYSDSFCCFNDDLNRDGRPDLIIVGFPGHPVRIYENPGPDKLGSHWKEHLAFPSCTNESPTYIDLDGDKKREIVCGFEPDERMAWFAPGAAIGDPWTCHPVSGPKAAGAARYYHGLGVGDVNKDGRADILIADGWYEAPEDRKTSDWKFHPIQPGPPKAQLHVHDFDGDGDQDVLGSSAHAYGIWWYEQGRTAEGKETWSEREIDKSFSQTHALVLADINKDGQPDFVTGKRFWAHGPKGDVGADQPAVLFWFELRQKDGKPEWTRHEVDNDSGVGIQFEVTDVNGDGLLDIVVANKKGVFYFEQKQASKAACG